MKDLGSQIAYWDSVGVTKTFTHPVNLSWLSAVSSTARILDYGCGYGRVMGELSEHGYSEVFGVDLSPALIERGRQSRPDLRFAVLESPPAIACAHASFDVVMLFAVLTCVPDDDAQRALAAELSRVLVPGGLLYVSDLLLQDDTRNQHRYSAHAQRFGTPYGVFTTGDGAVCRHHHVAHLRNVFAGFDLLDETRLEVATMNGHRSQAVQLLGRRR
ncbi:class I SAM-dependent methyltransferase [Micromonospora sp. CPCC 205539]|uniref:class I SAM-dependent methyltransferase n=1 Tax=Micromonospora sp. CPCC 205539 TaxID=3122408 RepID=UPI002FF0D1F2